MEGDFYRGHLHARHALEVLVPSEPDRREVHRIIYEELCVGQVRDASREHYKRVIGDLVDRGAQAVVLGCTEIDLLIGPQDCAVPTLDSTALHVDALLAAAR